jgi:hypothetical protein
MVSDVIAIKGVSQFGDDGRVYHYLMLPPCRIDWLSVAREVRATGERAYRDGVAGQAPTDRRLG